MRFPKKVTKSFAESFFKRFHPLHNTLAKRYNIKFNYRPEYLEYYDQHFFFLNEKYVGPINKDQLKFYKIRK